MLWKILEEFCGQLLLKQHHFEIIEKNFRETKFYNKIEFSRNSRYIRFLSEIDELFLGQLSFYGIYKFYTRFEKYRQKCLSVFSQLV